MTQQQTNPIPMKRLIVTLGIIIACALVAAIILAPRRVQVIRLKGTSFRMAGQEAPAAEACLLLRDDDSCSLKCRVKRPSDYSLFVDAEGKGMLQVSVDGIPRQIVRLSEERRTIGVPASYRLKPGYHLVTVTFRGTRAKLHELFLSNFYHSFASVLQRYNQLILDHAEATDLANAAIRAIAYTRQDISPRGVLSLCNIEAIAAEAFDRLREALRILFDAHQRFLQSGQGSRLEGARDQFERILFETQNELERASGEARETIRKLITTPNPPPQSAALRRERFGVVFDWRRARTRPPADVHQLAPLGLDFFAITELGESQSDSLLNGFRKALSHLNLEQRAVLPDEAIFRTGTNDASDEIVYRAEAERGLWTCLAHGRDEVAFPCGWGEASLTDGEFGHTTLRLYAGLVPLFQKKWAALPQELRSATPVPDAEAKRIIRCDAQDMLLSLKQHRPDDFYLAIINQNVFNQSRAKIFFSDPGFSARDLCIDTGFDIPRKVQEGESWVEVLLHRGGGTVLHLRK